MNIVKISGGLGNQMFQYALVLALRERGKTVKLDVSKYKYLQAHNNYELDKVFGINEEFANIEEVKKLGYIKENGIHKILIKSILRKKSYFKEAGMKYDCSVFNMDNKYLSGYWQNENYFIEIKDKINEIYNFREVNDYNYMYWKSRIQESSNSVSIHIRRGDYVNNPIYEGICDLDYYRDAIDLLRKRIGEDIELFFFSNDINWVKDNFKYKNMNFIEGNTKERSFLDIKLMSLCNNNIIANSSFSWWGAWLNENKNKIVVSPKKWINNKYCDSNSIIPCSWIKV